MLNRVLIVESGVEAAQTLARFFEEREDEVWHAWKLDEAASLLDLVQPDLMLLDEPMGALDPLVRYDLQNDLKEIFCSLQKTVLLVTHDLGEADFLGDNVILLKDGRIVQKGTLEDFANRPADPFVTDFIRAQRIPHLGSNQ